MDVGLYLDLRVRPDLGQDPRRVYGFFLEACEEADRRGTASAWFTVHHLFTDGYLLQPLTYAAAVAPRARRLRIGTSVLLTALRQAIQITEEAAVVDFVSEGRLDLGMSCGSLRQDYALLGPAIDSSTRRRCTCATRGRSPSCGPQARQPPSRCRTRCRSGWASTASRPPRRRSPWTQNLAGAPQLLEVYRDGLVEGRHDPDSGRFLGPMQAFQGAV